MNMDETNVGVEEVHVDETDVGHLGEYVLNQCSNDNSESEVMAPPLLSSIPNQLLAKDVSRLSKKHLPKRHNRGIPKTTYQPDLLRKVKYHMSQPLFVIIKYVIL